MTYTMFSSRAHVAGPNTWNLIVMVPSTTEHVDYAGNRLGETPLSPDEQLTLVMMILGNNRDCRYDSEAHITHALATLHRDEPHPLNAFGITLPTHVHLTLNATAAFSDDLLDATVILDFADPDHACEVISIERVEMPDQGNVLTDTNYEHFTDVASDFAAPVDAVVPGRHLIHPALYMPSGLLDD